MPKFSNADVAADSMVGARKLRAVTPADGVDLEDGIADALWINDTGVVIVNVVAEDDAVAVAMSVTGPGPLDVRARQVWDATTTATSIVAMY